MQITVKIIRTDPGGVQCLKKMALQNVKNDIAELEAAAEGKNFQLFSSVPLIYDRGLRCAADRFDLSHKLDAISMLFVSCVLTGGSYQLRLHPRCFINL